MTNEYYQKHKERLRRGARERYHNLSDKEKDNRRKKAQEIYQSFTEEEKEKRHQYYQECKQKLPEYGRNYYLTHKKKQLNHLLKSF